MTDISGITFVLDEFINFPSNMDTKNINKNNRNNLFIDAGLNMIG